MRKRWAIGLSVLAAFLIGGLALADDESDRISLIKSIDDKIKAIADELYGFESDSSGSDVDDALYAARELRDLVSKLERVKGDNSRASSIVSYYPGYVDTFNEAAKYLKRMKEQQRLGDGVADRCKTDESTLQSAIRSHVGKPDDAEDAFSNLPAMAKNYGRNRAMSALARPRAGRFVWSARRAAAQFVRVRHASRRAGAIPRPHE